MLREVTTPAITKAQDDRTAVVANSSAKLLIFMPLVRSAGRLSIEVSVFGPVYGDQFRTCSPRDFLDARRPEIERFQRVSG